MALPLIYSQTFINNQRFGWVFVGDEKKTKTKTVSNVTWIGLVLIYVSDLTFLLFAIFFCFLKYFADI